MEPKLHNDAGSLRRGGRKDIVDNVSETGEGNRGQPSLWGLYKFDGKPVKKQRGI